MTPEQLKSWQPHASETQLTEFIKENQTLLTLMEEAWQKFIQTQQTDCTSDIKPSVPEYAAGVDIDSLSHHPVTREEMIEFLNHFEKEREHNDRPFGDEIHIQEHDWQISD